MTKRFDAGGDVDAMGRRSARSGLGAVADDGEAAVELCRDFRGGIDVGEDRMAAERGWDA